MNRYHNQRRRTRSTSDFDNNVDQMKIINGSAVFKNKDHWSKASSVLIRLRNDSKFCDFELKVEDKVFLVHRVILSSSSTYFEAMFTNDLIEKETKFVEIKDITAKTFETLINYIYSGELTINENNVQELLSASNMLQLTEVVLHCSQFLRKHLDPTNCVGIYRFSEFHACHPLRLDTRKYIERNFAEVIREEEFSDLPIDLLKNLLRSEGLSIDSEFQVFEATINWIFKDQENRIKYFYELMECVRIPVIPIKLIESYINDCNNLELKSELDSYLQKDKESIESNEMQNSIAVDSKNVNHNGYLRSQPRLCARKYVYIVGGVHQSGHRWNDGKPLAITERFDILRNQWTSLPSLDYPRSFHCTAVLNGQLFVAGGECDSLIMDSTEIFDPQIKKWSKGPNLRQPRSCFGMCSLDNHIYALGGWIGNTVANSIERFDSMTNEWNFYHQLPDIRYAMGVIAFNGIIYIIGGFTDQNVVLKSVLSYNPINQKFKKLCEMHQSRAYFGCTVFHNNIYVIGGTTDGVTALASVERYNIYENMWSNVRDMPTPRISSCASSVNDCLLVFGGKTSGNEYSIPSTLNSVEIFDPESNHWNEGIPLTTSRCEAAVVVI